VDAIEDGYLIKVLRREAVVFELLDQLLLELATLD
jgi:hypothetical protein